MSVLNTTSLDSVQLPCTQGKCTTGSKGELSVPSGVVYRELNIFVLLLSVAALLPGVLLRGESDMVGTRSV